MKDKTKEILHSAWNYCDEQDKSTEFMIAYMQEAAGVSHDTVMDFIEQCGNEREDYKVQELCAQPEKVKLILRERNAYDLVNQAKTLENIAEFIEYLADDKGMIQGRHKKHNAQKMADNCRKFNPVVRNRLTKRYGIRQQAMYIYYKSK